MVEVFPVSHEALGELLEPLEVIDAAMHAVGVEYFLVGAAARDLLLTHVHNQPSFRATMDVDAAACVASWDQYEAVVAELVGTHGFARALKREHRLHRGALTIDIIPFGGVAEQGRIAWPSGTATMSVIGFDAAFGAAVGIAVDGGRDIPVASLPGIGLLKLIAWGESPYTRQQDPVDLCIILHAYEEISREALFESHPDLLANDDFDTRIAAARIYGRDMAALIRTGEARTAVLKVLEENTRPDGISRLAEAMGQECRADYPTRLAWLRALAQGVREARTPSERAT